MTDDLLALMRADAGIAAAVGTRVYWGVRPQGAELPAIVMHLIRAPKGYSLGGRSGVPEDRIQIDCLASGTFKRAKAVGDAVSELLDGYSGTVGDTQFQGIFQDSARDLSDVGAAEQQVFNWSLDFLARHQPQEQP